MKSFLGSTIESVIKQIKLPRKGVALILFVFSTCFILIDLFILGNIIDFEGSYLKQILYGCWMWSIFSFFAKMYNEYCDKRDIEKAEKENLKNKNDIEEKQREEAQRKLNEYLECIDTCNYDECAILISFYCADKTSISISQEELSLVAVLNNKGLGFVGGRSKGDEAIAYVTTSGLKVIKNYYDRGKDKFFNLVKNLNEDELKILNEFNYYNDIEIFLSRNKTKAKNIVNKFVSNGFDNIWINTERESLNISELYLCYLKQFFALSYID